MTNRWTRTAVAALVAGLVLGQPSLALAQTPVIEATDDADAPGDAADGVTWALRPASSDEPDGRVSLRHTIDPGATVQEQLALTNYSDAAAVFAVYASDGTISADGSFDLIPSGDDPTGGGAWVSLMAPEGAEDRPAGGFLIDVPAGGVVVVPVQIAVPSDASPGDHPAGVVAELVPDAATEVHLASRIGVRLHLRVSGDAVAEVRAEGVTASYSPSWNPFAPGTLTVDYAVANAGNVRLGASSVVSGAGPFGILSAQGPVAEQREILPTQSLPASTEFEVWPLFLMDGVVTVTPAVVGEDSIDQTPKGSGASFTVWTIPWAQLGLIALVVLGFVGFRRVRTRSDARVQERIDAAVAEAREAQASEASSGAETSESAERVSV